MFNTFEECRDYLCNIMTDTPHREKILEICQWLYSTGPSPRYGTEIKSYHTNEPGIRFCVTERGRDHFLCIKNGALYFYLPEAKAEAVLPEFVRRESPGWVRINGGDVQTLCIETLKNYIRESYSQRLNEPFPV